MTFLRALWCLFVTWAIDTIDTAPADDMLAYNYSQQSLDDEMTMQQRLNVIETDLELVALGVMSGIDTEYPY